MSDVNVEIRELGKSLQKLLLEYSRLKKENSTLREILKNRERELSTKNAAINELQEKVAAVSLFNDSLDNTQKVWLQKKIDAYLADIERCLTLLKN